MFSGPMKSANGKIYPPNNQKFKFKLCSFIRWQDDRIVEETIFVDNGIFVKQLGVDDCTMLAVTEKRIFVIN